MVIVISLQKAGQRVVVNDALLEFDEGGYCRGIIALGGGLEPLPEPLPLRAQDLDVLRQFPDRYDVIEELEGPGVEKPEEAEKPETETDDSREMAIRLLLREHKPELRRIAIDHGIVLPERITKRRLAEMIVSADH